MVDSALESWWFIFLSSEKILVIRTHPEELHVVKWARNTQISTDFCPPLVPYITYLHTPTYTYLLTHAHTYIQYADAYLYTPTYTHTYLHTHLPVHLHTGVPTQTLTHAYLHRHLLTHMPTYTDAYFYTCLHTVGICESQWTGLFVDFRTHMS